MMGCVICGENDYRYIGVDEEGDDVIECAECGHVQHFAEDPEQGIIRVDDDGYSSVASAGDFDGHGATGVDGINDRGIAGDYQDGDEDLCQFCGFLDCRCGRTGVY